MTAGAGLVYRRVENDKLGAGLHMNDCKCLIKCAGEDEVAWKRWGDRGFVPIFFLFKISLHMEELKRMALLTR